MNEVHGTLYLKRKGIFADSWPEVTCRYVTDSNKFSYDSPQAKADGKVLRVEQKGVGLTKRGHRFDVYLEGKGGEAIALSADSEDEMKLWCDAMEINSIVRQRLDGTTGTQVSSSLLPHPRFPLPSPPSSSSSSSSCSSTACRFASLSILSSRLLIHALTLSTICLPPDAQKIAAAQAAAQAIVAMPKDVKELLLRMAANDSGLAEVGLIGRSLGAAGAGAVAWALEGNTTVTFLNLGNNNIRDGGAECMVEMLKTNSTLTVLDLDNNNINDKGGQAMAEAIKVNSTLTVLYLHNNNINDKGGQAIAEAIKVNSTLTVLGLDSNNINDKGGQAIAEAIKVNSTLTRLFLDSNNINEELKRTIAALVATPGVCLACVVLACLMCLRCRCGESSSTSQR
jgi:hypothetical protein